MKGKHKNVLLVGHSLLRHRRGPSRQMDVLEGRLENLAAQHNIEVQQLIAKQNQVIPFCDTLLAIWLPYNAPSSHPALPDLVAVLTFPRSLNGLEALQEKLQVFEALLSSEKQENISLQKQLADLNCDLAAALEYRKQCLLLEKEIRRLKDSRTSAALGESEGIHPCDSRNVT